MQLRDAASSSTQIASDAPPRAIPPKGRPRTRTLLWGAYVVLALLAIFEIPYHLPLPGPVVSYSYVFGYSNRAGILLVVLFTAILAISTRGLGLHFATARDAEPVPRSTLWWALAGALVLCTAMYLLTGRLGGFGESSWLIDKIKLIDEGKVPYRDFEYVLGPLFIYGPILLKWALHLGVTDAYYLFWTISALAGISLLFSVIHAIGYPSKYKRSIFILLYLATLPYLLTTGANYTLTRFIPAAYFAVVVHRVFAAGSSLRRQVAAFGLAATFTACLYLISPEMAIAYALGTAIFFAAYGRLKGLAASLSYILLLLLLAGVSLAANALGMFQALKAYSGGAFNFPILPAPHILMFFVALALSASYVAVRVRGGAPPDNSLYIVAVSLPAIAAALGRCDPCHVVFSGLGILLTGSIYASTFKRGWLFYKWSFAVVLVVAPCSAMLWYYRALLTKAAVIDLFSMSGPQPAHFEAAVQRGLVSIYGEAEGSNRLKRMKLLGSHGNTAIDIQALYPHGTAVMDVPFGYLPNGFATYHASSLDEGRYIGLFNISSPPQVAFKISELIRHSERDLLLPESFESLCAVESSRDVLSQLLLYPYRRHPIHLESVTEPLCTFVATHYRLLSPPTTERFGYGLWEPQNER